MKRSSSNTARVGTISRSGYTDAVLQAYSDKGIGVLPTGQFDVDFHYYLNTEPKLDFFYELGNCPKLDLPSDLFWTYPPEKD
jgi:methylmalonyl-CoA/ethylmalonyl-CoA epimerase